MPDVDSYIAKFGPEIQERLMAIRFTALDIFQNVEEKIYHAIPAFMLDGKDILNYGAWKNHISIHLGYEWKIYWENRANDLMSFLKEKYPQYNYTKFTIQFANKEPFPLELIREICELLWQDR